MEEICKYCGQKNTATSKFCLNCGCKIETGIICEVDYCEKCNRQIPKGAKICDICAAKEESAATATATTGMNYSSRRKPRVFYSAINIFLNKAVILLLIICVFSFAMTSIASQFNDTIVNVFSKILPREQTTAYVLGTFKKVNELYSLKINDAEYYKYIDPTDKNKWIELIIRFHMTVRFNTKDIKVEKVDTAEVKGDYYRIILPRPIIEGRPDPGAANTGDKEADEFVGIEVFDSNGMFSPDTDDREAQIFIDNYIKENKTDIESKAYNNIKNKIQIFARVVDIRISEIVIQKEG